MSEGQDIFELGQALVDALAPDIDSTCEHHDGHAVVLHVVKDERRYEIRVSRDREGKGHKAMATAHTIARVKFLFEPRDLWVGVYWDRRFLPTVSTEKPCLVLYVCLIPTLVLRLVFR